MDDPRVKAAADAMMIRSQAGSLFPIPWEVLAQVALTAADASAWSTDIKQAPGLRHTVLVKLKDGRVTMANNEFGPGQDGWVDIVGIQTDIAESDIVAWRFCPDYQPLDYEE